VHDEVIAAGLIGISLFYLLSSKPVHSAATAVALFLFKETFFLYGISLGVVGLLLCRGSNGTNSDRPTHWPYVALIAISVMCAAWWFVVLPQVTERTFEPSVRIASISEWNTGMAGEKLKWLLLTLLPTFGIGLLSARGRLVLLAVAPFWGSILVSNFPEMWKPTNYYTLSTVMGTFFAAGCFLADKPSRGKLAPILVSVALQVAFLFSIQVKPLGTLTKLSTGRIDRPGAVDIFPPHSRILVSEFDVLFLSQDVTPIRLWTANRLPTHWSYLLVRRDNPKELPDPTLLENREHCWANHTWVVYCASPADRAKLRL